MCPSDKKFKVKFRSKQQSGEVPDQLFTKEEAIHTVSVLNVINPGIEHWYEPVIVTNGGK
jgi:hypothetical protein